jgi:hypothetical protein
MCAAITLPWAAPDANFIVRSAALHVINSSMLASHEPRNGVVDLPSPGVPADHGLASLGLVMQFAGRTSGALAALLASVVVLEARVPRHAGWFFLVIALCIARSQLHRIAGRDLVYSRRTLEGAIANPFDAMRTYIVFGIGHALVIGLIAATDFGATNRTAAGITAALALWPMTLAVLWRLPSFRPLHAGIPLGEDRGLEGASILMTVFGACGVLSTGAIGLVLGELPSRHLQHGWGVMLVVTIALLLVRSCLHMRAGLAGLRETSFDHPGDLAGRYACFGVISAVCIGGILMLLAMSERLAPEAIAGVTVTCWLFVAWPMIVKRYFHHRQFAELLAGDRVIHRRAPDAGLTGLGWLLTGHAILIATILILAVTVERHGAGRALDNLVMLSGPVIGRSAGDLAVAAGIVALELTAAAALLWMSDHRRVIATIYALIAGGLALALAWPLVRGMGHHPFHLQMVIRVIPSAVQIVVPAATLVLVHRAIMPVAQARCRKSAAPPRHRYAGRCPSCSADVRQNR